MHEKQNLTPRISDLWILIETNWLGGISKNYESKLEEKFRVRNRNVWIGLAKAQSELVWWTLYNTPNGAMNGGVHAHGLCKLWIEAKLAKIWNIVGKIWTFGGSWT